MKIDSWKCDGCGVQKKDANHWFKGYQLVEKGIVIAPWDTGEAFIAGGGTLSLDIDRADAHLCGASCVTEWLSKNLL